MDPVLQEKVNQIKALAAEQQRREYEALDAAMQSAASSIGSGGFAVAPDYEAHTSNVDVDEVFRPFLQLPDPLYCDATIDKIVAAGQDLTKAWNELVTRLGANAANWTGEAGDAFNSYVARLTYASWEHTVLFGEFESLHRTYRDLVVETRAAAHEFADQTIEALRDIGRRRAVDWTALINVVVTGAMVLAVEMAPPAGAAVLALTRLNAIGGFALAGKAALEGVSVGGDDLRGLMDSVVEAARRLTEGAQAKGQILADALDSAPGLIDQHRADVAPPPPVIPQT